MDAGDLLPSLRLLSFTVQVSGARHSALHLVAHVLKFFLVTESSYPFVYLFYLLF